VGNSEVEKICGEIYRKHKTALDLIFQYKPDISLEISEYLQELIKGEEGLELDHSSKTYIKFTTNIIDNLIEKRGEGWTRSGRILMYEFRNTEDKLSLHFLIGTGDQSYREKIYGFCKKNKELFNSVGISLYKKYHTLYMKKILSPNDFKEATIDDLTEKINTKWKAFKEKDFINIDKYFKENWV
jgi:hypothetical protein